MRKYEDWNRRAMNVIRRVEAIIDNAKKSDMLFDLLLLTVIDEVREYLYDEYITSYKDVAGFEPEMYEVDRSAYLEIEGKDFEDRITEHFETEPDLETIKERVKLVIITDGHRVWNAAGFEAAQELSRVGYTVTKTWRSVKIPTTRDTHFDLDMTTIPINEYFYTVNGRTLYPGGFGVPQEDINCLCWLDINVTEEIADE